MAVCKRCKKAALVIDDVTGNTVCSACGIVQDFTNFQEQFGDGGNYVTHGTTGSGHDYSYKERKLFHSKNIIEDITFRLNFGDARACEVKEMVNKVTEGEYGLGNWFSVLVGACCYIVMRQNSRILTINEVCDAVECELYEMGRMVGRVVDFLGLELPEFDVVGLLEKTIRGFSRFQEVDKEKVEVMVKQGNFVVQCCIKWWLTTGRRPGPVAVAVLVFVAGMNEIKVRIEDVAKEVNVGIATCRLRYKELLEALVEIAKALPWGNDINVKNILRNAHCVMKYMEMKSMESKENDYHHKKRRVGNGDGNVIHNVFSDIFGGDVDIDVRSSASENDSQVNGDAEGENGYHKKRRVGSGDGNVVCNVFRDNFDTDVDDRSDVLSSATENDSQVNGDAQGENGYHNSRICELNNVQTCLKSLANQYTKFKADFSLHKFTNRDEVLHYGDDLDDLDLEFYNEWWSGKSELCEKLLLEQLEEKDVGLNKLPPSYIRGCEAVKRRREKIKAAKIRINSIRFPSTDVTVCRSSFESSADLCLSETTLVHKKRTSRSEKRKEQRVDIDWEDFIIETLLLHKVKEEEIEKGHYKALLGLHVFKG